MSKDLKVSLAFTANTNEAIASIKKLQKELNGLATGATLKTSGITQITPEIQKAMVAAGELQTKLEAATNLKTGKLDLGIFSESLKKSGVSLQQYATQLSALGPVGRQTFISLAQSVIQAEAPLVRCNAQLKELGTSLANTARWQISSSVLHGFMGAISTAYGYAQDLNKSLNDIRIVTGKSIDDMDAFAKKANSAAKALSATTNEYAKASLIYFQQGDTESQAMDKAAITTKMANVTGQSAEVVSNQLTAIWNNFNKEGDVAYEHYADILTKLGAETASSTDEIAGGLEKFAGVAEQIGLSYEYAASALATITATSRESEEVVGTALKTVFARIQGLNLGETLDDGTTLNKYSQALQKVGVSIFEHNGEIKNMDSILEEMAAKWKTLSKDQQTALAQTVAGVRQYTQLVTLMDNWDFMETNLATAMSAEGELDKQAEIYAEGWEAARDRVRASAEAIYTKILDDDFFIGFLDTLDDAIDGVGSLIDAFGGLGGVLTTVGAFATKLFRDEIIKGLHNVGYTVNQFTGKGKKEQEATKEDAMRGLENLYSNTPGESGKAENAALKREYEMQQQLKTAAGRLTEEELKQLQIQMDLVRAMDQRAIAAAKNVDLAEQELKVLQEQNRIRTKMDVQKEVVDDAKSKIAEDIYSKLLSGDKSNDAIEAMAKAEQSVRSAHNLDSGANIESYRDEINRAFINEISKSDLIDEEGIRITLNTAIKEALSKAQATFKANDDNVNSYQNQINLAGRLYAQGENLSRLGSGALTVKTTNKNGEEINKTGKDLENVYTQLEKRIVGAKAAAEALSEEVKENSEAKSKVEELVGKIETLEKKLKDSKDKADALDKILKDLDTNDGLGEEIQKIAYDVGGTGGIVEQDAIIGINQPSFNMEGQFEGAAKSERQKIATDNLNKNTEEAKGNLDEGFKKAGGLKDWTDSIALATDMVAGLGSTITSVQGIIDVFNSPDATAWDAVSAVLSGVVGILPLGISLFNALGTSMAASLGPIALIIAGVVGLTVVFKTLSNQKTELEKLNDTVEQATNKAREMKNSWNEAESALVSFKNELSDYNDSIKGLQQLTVGTEEMSNAVSEANKKARELIETYKLLSNEDYSYGSFGEIIISQEAQNKILNKLQKSATDSEKRYYDAEIQKIDSELNYQAQKIADDIGIYKTYQIFERNKNNLSGKDLKEMISAEDMSNYVDLNQIVSKDFGKADYFNETSTGGVQTTDIEFTSKDLDTLRLAVGAVEKELGHIPGSAEEFIKEINQVTDYYGLSQSIVYDLNNILKDGTYNSLLDFCNQTNEATKALTNYTEQILGLTTNDAYSDVVNELANGDQVLADLMYGAKNTILKNNDSDLLQEYQQKKEQMNTDIVTDNSLQANDTEVTLQTYVESIPGFNTDYNKWLEENYSKIFEGTTQTKTAYLTTQDMGKALVESKGYKITNVTKNDDGFIYDVVDAEGNPAGEFDYSNQQIANEWKNQIANYALDEWAKTRSLEAVSTEDLNSLFSNIINNSNQYGADFKYSILSGIQNGQKTFDFSSVYGELSKEEIDEIRNMSGQQIGEKFLGSSDINTLTDLGFQSWHQFANAFKAGLDNWDPSIYIDSMNEKYEAIAKEKNIDVGTFKAYRKSSEAYEGFENDTGEEYGKNWLEDLKAGNIEEYTEALNELAIMQTRLSKGYKTLGDNWKDWNKVMSDSEASIDDINEIMPDLNEALADILNWDIENIELLPHDFAQKHWDIIQDVYNGVDGAYEKLAGLATQEYMVHMGIDSTGLEGDALTAFNTVNSWLENMPDLEVGMTLDDSGMTSAFQDLLDAGVVTADQMTAILSNIGYDPQIEYEKVELSSFDRQTQQGYVQMVGVDGKVEYVPITSNMDISGEQYVYVPKLKGSSTYTGGGGSSVPPPKTKANKGGGGGGSKKKTSEARKDKTDVVDRYKEVNDKLEETQRLMDKNNTLADGLWGPDKIALMKENIKLMEKENKYLQEKYELSKKYLAEDKAALEAAAADAGINFTFNNDDNISNYTEQMTALFNQREALLDSFGEEMDEKEQERLDEFDKKVEALKSAYELYETTLDEKKDLEEEHLEKMLEIQEEYYNVLNEELEVKVSINESDLEVIDYYLNKISDDFYQMAEAAALMVGSLDDLSSGKMGGQMAEYFDGLDIQKNYLESLEHDYNTINPETGTTYINQQQYIEGLRESRSEIINNLSAINDLDKEMLDYYANTLSMASDELDKFTSKLEHQTSVLEHYKTIMDVLGKSQDYEAMGIILEGQVTTVENELKVAEETYKLYRSQADDKRKLYEQAIAAGNQAAAELYKREWEAAEEAATEAQDNMLSKTEEWAEAMKTVLRNSLDGFADELEKALTGGSSFDYINTQMERAASLQEEYLTTTNKIYETNKLMRKAQQEIDKTTNTIAKQRLKDFIKETDQLQDKSQLSKYELEIQQAKYDLLLAEIALQEAQNAKSTVRLQRDSEGNFGYVYTADQNEIDNAEQALEDAQNNLYNIGLRGATEYVEKYNQTMSAMYDTFRELEEARFNNEISQDEYNQRMLEAQEYYYQELSNFQDLYGIALDADSRVYQDAWTSAFTGMMDSSEVWKDKVTEYSENAQTAFEEWATKVDEIAQRTGLDDISEKVKEVTNDSEELKNTILGDGKKDKGVIGALEEELNAVSNLTEEYGSLRGMIQGLIKDYGGLLTAINNAEHAEAEGIEDDSKTEGAPSSTSDSNSGNSNEDTGRAQTAAAPSLTTGSQIQVKPGTRWYGDSFGGGSSGSARGGTISYINENGSHPYNIEGMGWIKKTDIVGYDTGGYTGSWEGSYGKLAFLHQKELILNAKDTENLLQSMDFLNNIISTIDLYSANAQLGSALMNPYINNTNTKDTLEQRVYIEASFPGVSDHNELEEAFNNLINTASQYANRK